MLPNNKNRLHEARTLANRAPLYIPTQMTYQLLFEPCLFDPYFRCRVEYLKAAGYYTASEQHMREILLVARLRMENCNNRAVLWCGVVVCCIILRYTHAK